MKVVMTVSNPFKPDPRVYKEAKSLVKAGHEVYVIAWDREGKYPEEEVVDGIKVIRLGPRATYGSAMVLKLPLFYLNAFNLILKLKPHVIHTHDFDTAVLGFIFKRLKGTKWIYDVHDLYFTFFSMEGKTGFLQKVLRELVRRIDLLFTKHADQIIVATQSIGGTHEGLRECYVKEGIPPEKIMTIWNVPDVEFFERFDRLKLKKSNKFTIGFIGPQRTVSNFIALFEAIKYEPEKYKVLLVGEGKSTKKLKQFVRERYSNLDVEFFGNVDYKLVPNYYLLCDAVFAWYPPRENIKRAIAIKVFESASLGIPVIVNKGSLMEDFVKEYRCGVAVETPSPMELQRALILLRRMKFRSKMVQKKWNWRNEKRKLQRMYLLLGGGDV